MFVIERELDSELAFNAGTSRPMRGRLVAHPMSLLATAILSAVYCAAAQMAVAVTVPVWVLFAVLPTRTCHPVAVGRLS